MVVLDVHSPHPHPDGPKVPHLLVVGSENMWKPYFMDQHLKSPILWMLEIAHKWHFILSKSTLLVVKTCFANSRPRIAMAPNCWPPDFWLQVDPRFWEQVNPKKMTHSWGSMTPGHTCSCEVKGHLCQKLGHAQSHAQCLGASGIKPIRKEGDLLGSTAHFRHPINLKT